MMQFIRAWTLFIIFPKPKKNNFDNRIAEKRAGRRVGSFCVKLKPVFVGSRFHDKARNNPLIFSKS